ncbi:MAG: DUF1553 domain-containing protein [Verrucomicrobiales bacterium]|nr:DUF1553 domain-containing protein [Verrucomicrobiales bacterium]
MMRKKSLIVGSIVSWFVGLVTSVSAADADKVDFNQDVMPILSDKCFHCHGPDKEHREADLRLDVREAAIEAGAIVPGDVKKSEFLVRLFHDDPEELMPPAEAKLGALTAKEKDILKRWIEQGAEYKKHWSFVEVPKVVPLPKLKGEGSWGRNEMDAFVLARLQKHQLQASAEASRERWLRRVSFDLTGLPPSLKEIDAFLADQSGEQAYEKVVDRLLASKAYGERMASDWLDSARYADTFGYQADRLMHVWPWRDWVIRAFNDNLPYDKFVLWQTAGDLLPNATLDQRLATTFNRLNRQTNEGGSINEEFRVEYVSDRTETNGTAFLGITIGCSKCHDHKFDPWTQQGYYEMSAFFNNIDESGLYSHFTETAPTPTLLLYSGDQQAKHQALLKRIKDSEKNLDAVAKAAEERFANWQTGGDQGQAELPKAQFPKALLSLDFDNIKKIKGGKIVAGKQGEAAQFSGDDPYAVCDEKTAAFHRTDEFSFSLWLKPSVFKSRQVIFHRSKAAEDAAFRGYELMLYDGKPTFSLIHFWPGNALRVQAKKALPLNAWTHLTITYDGSSQASGVEIFLNGKPHELVKVQDKLTRDIDQRAAWGDSGAGENKLTLAGRFRDIGFAGGAIDEFQVFDRQLTPVEVALLAGVEKSTSGDALFVHYLLRQDVPFAEARTVVQRVREEENALISEVKQIMTMRDMKGQRAAYRLNRGQYAERREEAYPDTPVSLFPMDKDWPKNRLGLAKWMIDGRNPLVSRVAVNRLWQTFFGRGIVATPEDLGTQGTPPTHPQMLDWMARDFMDSGWDVKAMMKKIALSSVYRQDSTPQDPRSFAEDPDNRLLARGPRHRLSAEQVRDNVLAVSGLLVDKVGGRSVKPYELAAAFKPQTPDKGEGLYRRSLYTFLKRTAPPPVMSTFDATAREVCMVRRERTSTPLQALVLMNGPQYVEAARVFAQHLIENNGADVKARIVQGFRQCTSRKPQARELEILQILYEEQKEHFAKHPGEASKLLKIGDRKVNTKLAVDDMAATTILCEAMMNFDETITKR